MAGLKICVTGASGFVGHALVMRLLDQGHAVIAVDDASSTIDNPTDFPPHLSQVRLNLLNPTELLPYIAGCDCVVHLVHNDQASLFDQLDFAIRSNETLLRVCAEAQVKKFIHISSTAVYGDPPPSGVITEASPYLASIRPQTSIRQAAEKRVLETEAGDTEVVVLQIGRVYGAGMGGETERSLNQMKTTLMPIVRQGTGYCNLIYIDDVVSAIVRACEVPNLHQQRFIITQDQPVSWSALLSGYESILKEKSLIHLPINYPCNAQDSIPLFTEIVSQVLKKGKIRDGTSAIAKLFYGKSIDYPSADEFRAFVAQPIFSNQKCRDHLNFQPQISLQTGIEKIREWWCQASLETV